MTLKRLCSGIGFVVMLLGTACGRDSVDDSNTKSLGISHPLGGSRFVVVSDVDKKVWGVVCPGPVDEYVGFTSSQIVSCGYTQSIGPVRVEDLVRAMPADVDSYSFEKDLRSDKVVPVGSSRDKYYDAWDVLERLAKVNEVRPGQKPCLVRLCDQPSVVLNIDVYSNDATIYIHSTTESGHIGSYEIRGGKETKVFNLNVSQKVVVNVQGGANVYVARALKEKVIVQGAGRYKWYFIEE